jgi:hypothetical protein
MMGDFYFVLPLKKIISTPQNTDSRKNWVENKEMRIGSKNGLYTGEIENGIPNGEGMFTLPSGNKYLGGWKDGRMSGQGIGTYSDGRKYVGEWRDGKLNGQGTLTWSDGSKYVGDFKDDKFHGQGTMTAFDSKSPTIPVIIMGAFKDGFPNGNVKMTSAVGTYFGEVKDATPHGYGVMILPDGKKIDGEWKDDRPWNVTVYEKNGELFKKLVNGKEIKQ